MRARCTSVCAWEALASNRYADARSHAQVPRESQLCRGLRRVARLVPERHGVVRPELALACVAVVVDCSVSLTHARLLVLLLVHVTAARAPTACSRTYQVRSTSCANCASGALGLVIDTVELLFAKRLTARSCVLRRAVACRRTSSRSSRHSSKTRRSSSCTTPLRSLMSSVTRQVSHARCGCAIGHVCRDLSANQFAQVPSLVWRMRKLQSLDLTRNLVASCVDPAPTGQPLNASLATLCAARVHVR